MNNKIILFFILSIFSSACVFEESNIPKKKYLIVLDLSDRILNEDQIDRDIEQIIDLRNLFLDDVKKYILEDDEGLAPENIFEIQVVHQSGKANINFSNLLKDLKIDFTGVNDDKRETLKILGDKNSEAHYRKALKKLYSKAKISENSNDYNGADFYKFFNEDYEKHIESEYDNFLFIITDGLLYFESINENLSKGCYNKMNNLVAAVNLYSVGWESRLINDNLRMNPIKNKYETINITCFLLQIKEEENIPDHYLFLDLVWKRWLNGMGISKIQTYKVKDSPGNNSQISDILSGKKKVIEYKELSKTEVVEKNKSNQTSDVKITQNKYGSNQSLKNNYSQNSYSLLNEYVQINDKHIKAKRFVEEVLFLSPTEIDNLMISDPVNFVNLLNNSCDFFESILPKEGTKEFDKYCNTLNEMKRLVKKNGDSKRYNLLLKLDKLCYG